MLAEPSSDRQPRSRVRIGQRSAAREQLDQRGESEQRDVDEPSIVPIEALDVEPDGDRLVIGGRTDATAFELRLRRVRPEDFRLVRQPRRWIDQRSTMWDP